MQKSFWRAGFASVFVIVLALVVVGVGAVLLTKKSVAPPPDAGDMTNWKTYRNEEYGFEFRYSSGTIDIFCTEEYSPFLYQKIEDSSCGVIRLTPSGVTYEQTTMPPQRDYVDVVFYNPAGMSMKDFMKKQWGLDLDLMSKDRVGNIEYFFRTLTNQVDSDNDGRRISPPFQDRVNNVFVAMPQGFLSFAIRTNYSSEMEEVFYSILPTFEFIK